MRQETIIRARTACESIRKHWDGSIGVGVILGSGMSDIARGLADSLTIPFGDIEGFPSTGVQGHRGELFMGPGVAVMAGRFHYYEGHDMDTVALPVLTLRELGVHTLLLTNAAGGIHHSCQPGDLVLISDHINLQGSNPLMGPHVEGAGPRFPDMSSVYDPSLRSLARTLDPQLREGVYAALSGPCYETPAEIRMLRAMGADLVGMSTVPEAIMASALGMRILGISLVTNPAAGLGSAKLDHQEVLAAGKSAETRLGSLLGGLRDQLLSPS